MAGRAHPLAALALALVLGAGWWVTWECPRERDERLGDCLLSCGGAPAADRPACRSRCRVQAAVDLDLCQQSASKYYSDIGATDAALASLNGIREPLLNATAARYAAVRHTQRDTSSSKGYDICSKMVTNVSVVKGSECGGRDDGHACAGGEGVCVLNTCMAVLGGGEACPSGSDGRRCLEDSGVCRLGRCLAIIEPFEGCAYRDERERCDRGRGVCAAGQCVAINPDSAECAGKVDTTACNGGFGTCLAERCAALVWGADTLDFTCKRDPLPDGALVADGRGLCWRQRGLEVTFPPKEPCEGAADGGACRRGNGTCLSGWCVLRLPPRDECADKADGQPCFGGSGACGGHRCLEAMAGASCASDGAGCAAGLGACFFGRCLELGAPFDGCGPKGEGAHCNYFRGRCMFGLCIDLAGTQDRECLGAGTDGYRCNRGMGICLDQTCIRTLLDGNSDCASASDGAPCADRTGACWRSTCVPVLAEPEDECAQAKAVSVKPTLDEEEAVTASGEWLDGIPCDSGDGACFRGRCIDVAEPFECSSRPDMSKCDDLEGRCVGEACEKGARFMPRSESDFTYVRTSVPYDRKFETEESLLQTECNRRVAELMGEGPPALRPCLTRGDKERDGCFLGNAVYYEGYAPDPDYFLGVLECTRASDAEKRDKCLVGPGPKLVYKSHRTHPTDSCDIEPDETHVFAWGGPYFTSSLRRSLCLEDMAMRFLEHGFARYGLEDCERIPHDYKRTACYRRLGAAAFGDTERDVSVPGCAGRDADIASFGTVCAQDPWKCDEKGDPNNVHCPLDPDTGAETACDKAAIAARYRNECHTGCLQTLWHRRNVCYRSAARALARYEASQALSICNEVNGRVASNDEDASGYTSEDAARHVPCVDASCFRSACMRKDKECGDWGQECWQYWGTCIVDRCGDRACIDSILRSNRDRGVRDSCYHDVLDATLSNAPSFEAEHVCGGMIASPVEQGNCFTQVATNVALDPALGGFVRAVSACSHVSTGSSPQSDVGKIRDSCFSAVAEIRMSADAYASVPICLAILDGESLSGCLLNAAKRAKKLELVSIKREASLPFDTVVRICNKGKRATDVGLSGAALLDVIDLCNLAFDRVRTICDLIPNPAAREGCLRLVDPLDAARDAPADLEALLESTVSGLEGEEQNELAMLARQKIETAKALHRECQVEEARLVAGELIVKAEGSYEEAEYRAAISYADRAIDILRNAALAQSTGHGAYATFTEGRDPDALRAEALSRIKEAEELYALAYGGREGTADVLCDAAAAARALSLIESARASYAKGDYLGAIRSAVSAISAISSQPCYAFLKGRLATFKERLLLCAELERAYNVTGPSCRECRLCDSEPSPAAIWRCLVERCVDRSAVLGAICARFCSAHAELSGCVSSCLGCASCADRLTPLAQDSCLSKCVGEGVLGELCRARHGSGDDVEACLACRACLAVPANLTACLDGCEARKRPLVAEEDRERDANEAGYDLSRYLELRGFDPLVREAFAPGPSATPAPEGYGDVERASVGPGATSAPRTEVGDGSGGVADLTRGERSGSGGSSGGSQARPSASPAKGNADGSAGEAEVDREAASRRVASGGSQAPSYPLLWPIAAVALIGCTLLLVLFVRKRRREVRSAATGPKGFVAQQAYGEYSSYYADQYQYGRYGMR